MSQNNRKQNSDFYAAFSNYVNVSNNISRDSNNQFGGAKSKRRNHVNLEQTGGAAARITMNTVTVIGHALANVTTAPFYAAGIGGAPAARNALYMRGEIVGDKLNVSLISALVNNGAAQNVCANAPAPAAAAGSFSWSHQTTIVAGNTHSIEIREGNNIYSQQFGAAAPYSFLQNGNPGVALINAAAAAVGAYYVPGAVAPLAPLVVAPGVGANAPGPAFITRDFLIVDLTNTRVYNSANEEVLSNTRMTEEIINFLLHQLVQYKLAKSIICIYEDSKATQITARGNTTLTSYVDYNNIRLANDFQDNVFSQCFEYNDLTGIKKIVHAVTRLEPTDSSINMKYCSPKNMNGLANLTKALAISDPFTRKLNEESIFYLCLRVHTLAAGANLVQAQQTAGDEFLSGAFGTNAGAINAAKLIDMNSPNRLAVRFDYIPANGAVAPAVVDKGIGRFVVEPARGDLMIYDESSKKNVRLVCYNYDDAANHNMIQPYDRFINAVAGGAVQMESPKIDKAGGAGAYRLVIQTKAAGGGAAPADVPFANAYDPAAAVAGAAALAPATAALAAATTIAMHVCTASTSEIQSNITLAQALFE